MKFILPILLAQSFASALQCSSPTGVFGCIEACHELFKIFPGQVSNRNSTAYNGVIGTYWAYQQQEIEPSCVFEPANSEQVAYLVRLSRVKTCPFAIKSGGHGAFAGASNIENGITVALDRLNEISVSDDLRIATIGTGNRWIRVYEKLEEYKLAVAGGRHPDVGVGGLSLGGGESFFATMQGWTCDNIKSHEVVTADGQIIEANETSHADLHWALRGGGNNFGIVTKIRMQTIPLTDGKMWGGLRIHTENHFPALLQAANNLGYRETGDALYSAQIINFMRFKGQKLATSILTSSKPERNPPSMGEYLSIPSILDTTRVSPLTNLSSELASSEAALGNVTHIFRARGTATFTLNTKIMTFAMNTCFDEIEKLSDVQNGTPMCVFQVITKSQLEATIARGSNALGLNPQEGPLFLLNTQAGWTNYSDTPRVQQAVQRIIERTTEYGKKHGWDNQFRYMNYAGEFQDIFSGYGDQNKDRLVTVANKYDPAGVFYRLQPGYFKLIFAPAGMVI